MVAPEQHVRWEDRRLLKSLKRRSLRFGIGIRLRGRFSSDGTPAERAGGVRMEPHVDALKVEAMVTLGQQPDLLAVRQLGEADRALEPLLEVRGPVDGDG